jgi:virginiamycin B lyase
MKSTRISTAATSLAPLSLSLALVLAAILAGCDRGQSGTPTVVPAAAKVVAPAAVSRASQWKFTQYEIPTRHSGPWGIVAGPDGAMWFTESGANKIGRITNSGHFTECAIPTSNSHPQSITVGRHERLWFTEYSANKIGRITTDGKIFEYAVPTPNAHPWGIVGGDDIFGSWFTESSDDKYAIIRNSGFPIIEFSLHHGAIPRGIAKVGSFGDIWLTEYGRNSVFRTTFPPIEFHIPTSNAGPAGIAGPPTGGGVFPAPVWFTEELAGKIGEYHPGVLFREHTLPGGQVGLSLWNHVGT